MARTAQMGGPVSAPGAPKAARRGVPPVGEESYLWLLIGLELAATVLLRQKFRTCHGG